MFLVLIALTGTVPDGYRIAKTQRGLATVYWPGDGHSGKLCADGKPFTRERCHIAHRSWRLGSKVRVCSRKTGRCTITYVGDRGPFGACDHRGIVERTHRHKGKLRFKWSCYGKWLIKIRQSDPGTWRGVADLSKCVWKKIGGPGMQVVRLDLLKPTPAQRRRVAQPTAHPIRYSSYLTVQADPFMPTVHASRHEDSCCLWPWRSPLSPVVHRRSSGQGRRQAGLCFCR